MSSFAKIPYVAVLAMTLAALASGAAATLGAHEIGCGGADIAGPVIVSTALRWHWHPPRRNVRERSDLKLTVSPPTPSGSDRSATSNSNRRSGSSKALPKSCR